jgi:hypothetical protein
MELASTQAFGVLRATCLMIPQASSSPNVNHSPAFGANQQVNFESLQLVRWQGSHGVSFKVVIADVRH